ncbi:MAG: hypothetical protein M3Z25_16160 [Actinomycetota bacterium]|nr:hypothetical protein [Actinomycetota bacterium]
MPAAERVLVRVPENKLKWGFGWIDRGRRHRADSVPRPGQATLAPVRALASVSFQGKVEEEMVDGMNHTLPPSRPTPSRRAGKPLP